MLIEATTQTTDSHVYIMSGNDDLNVAAGITIRSLLTDAVTTWEGQHHFTVAGSIYGHDDGINTIGCIPAQTIEIATTGYIHSGDDHSVVDADGIILDGVGSSVLNRGTIVAQGTGIAMFVRDGGTTTVTNYGTISGEIYGIHYKFGSGTFSLTNYGTIESPNKSYFGQGYVDLVTNRGTMTGAVELGGGNDVYDGIGGRANGTIYGGDGDDTFLVGSYSETIDAGAGIDTLNMATATANLTIDLVNNANNRGTPVLGDHYTGLENVISGSGSDRLVGDAQANMINGNAGNDTLLGGDGDDSLFGGSGRDTLTGGNGADAFVFLAPSNGYRDVITDFAAGQDTLLLEGSAFGYGTYAGALSAADFNSGGTIRSNDASDHFFFRTTDQTLWFDADGKGGAGAYMIADLQTGATLTAAQIFFI